MLAFAFFLDLSFDTLSSTVKAEFIFPCFEAVSIGIVTWTLVLTSGKSLINKLSLVLFTDFFFFSHAL